MPGVSYSQSYLTLVRLHVILALLATWISAKSDDSSNPMHARTRRNSGLSVIKGSENYGTVMTHWNTRTCGADGIPLITGYIGTVTPGSELLCISNDRFTPEAPGSGSQNATGRPGLQLVTINSQQMQPESQTGLWRAAHGKLMSCAKCLHLSSDVVVNYGTLACPERHGFKLVYFGYAMAAYTNTTGSLYSSDVICAKEEKASNYKTNSNYIDTPEMSFVSFFSGQSEQILKCVVCRKIEEGGEDGSESANDAHLTTIPSMRNVIGLVSITLYIVF